MSGRGMVWVAYGTMFLCSGCGHSTSAPQAGKSKSKPSRQETVAQSLEQVPAADPQAKGKSSAAEAAFAELVNASQDSDPDEWARSEAVLAELGADAVPVLVQHLTDPNPFARELAVQFLAQLGSAAASAEPELVLALTDESSLVRMNAAAALLSMNSSSKEIVPTLVALLNDADESIRLPAAISLAGMNETADDAVAALMRLLSASKPSVRLGSVEALGRLGDKAAASLAAVRRLMKDAAPEVRTAAQVAAQRIAAGETESSEAIPAGGVEP